MPFARLAHGGSVHYADRGERRAATPPALFVHGAGASSAIWMMALARAARASYAVAIDLPGHGPTPRLPGDTPVTITAYRDAVGLLAASLCLGPSVLVGHSMGALVAIAAALAWPDKVRGLVLCGAAARLPVDDQLVRLIREDQARVPAWLADRGLSPSAKPAVRRGFVAAGVAAPSEITLADFEALRAPDADLGARLDQLACPIIWLDGADDRLVPPAPARRPGQVRTLPGVGHLVPIEAPGAVAEAVAEVVGQ